MSDENSFRAGALDGVSVLEVGVFIAAPFATLQLADLGADVIKVENLDGEPVRASGPFVNGESSTFLRLNRSKRSVALDLKSAGGKRAFLRLAATADVVVENLRPGAMRALGLSYDDIRAVNPRVVYASASGFGQDGPLADRPGLDIMAQARGGLMSITGAPGGAPAKVGVPVCDLVCALYVALGIVAALRERDRSGTGQYLDVSLLESAVSLAVWEAGRFFATGEIGRPLGSAHQSEAPYQALRSADGWLTLGAVTPKTWAALCRALELEHVQDDRALRDLVAAPCPPRRADTPHRGADDDADDGRCDRTFGASGNSVCADRRLRRTCSPTRTSRRATSSGMRRTVWPAPFGNSARRCACRALRRGAARPLRCSARTRARCSVKPATRTKKSTRSSPRARQR